VARRIKLVGSGMLPMVDENVPASGVDVNSDPSLVIRESVIAPTHPIGCGPIAFCSWKFTSGELEG
jgi:hypothetical protein